MWGEGGCPASFFYMTQSSGTDCSVSQIPLTNPIKQSSEVDCITKPVKENSKD